LWKKPVKDRPDMMIYIEKERTQGETTKWTGCGESFKVDSRRANAFKKLRRRTKHRYDGEAVPTEPRYG
jgi:hypothetical protein